MGYRVLEANSEYLSLVSKQRQLFLEQECLGREEFADGSPYLLVKNDL